MALIVENQYFPPVDVFKILRAVKHVKIEQCEAFQKASFRNRCVVFGANGPTSLAVPVTGGREQKRLIKEVEIDYSQHWARTHLRSSKSGYSKAPFFDYYFYGVESTLTSHERFLFDLNLRILSFLLECLDMEVSLDFTESFQLNYPNDIDLRNRILPRNFQNNRGGWEPRYSQVFEDRWGFQPNLSILDLLFNEGPNAANLLKTSKG